MKRTTKDLSRRAFACGGLAFGAGLLWTPGALAEALLTTPQLTEGPFYPDKLPLDTDNDLLILNNSITPAIGEITHLTGRVLSEQGAPVRNAFVEIWQVDGNGVYLHTADTRQRDRRDANFQGYGRFLTDSTGQYYFRTIKPVPYPGRTPHIHVAISQNGRRIHTTQLFVNGDPLNDSDGVLRGVRDRQAFKSLLVDFEPVSDSQIGELAANFDIVLGVTPQEREDGALHGGIGESSRGNSRQGGGSRRQR